MNSTNKLNRAAQKRDTTPPGGDTTPPGAPPPKARSKKPNFKAAWKKLTGKAKKGPPAMITPIPGFHHNKASGRSSEKSTRSESEQSFTPPRGKDRSTGSREEKSTGPGKKKPDLGRSISTFFSKKSRIKTSKSTHPEEQTRNLSLPTSKLPQTEKSTSLSEEIEAISNLEQAKEAITHLYRSSKLNEFYQNTYDRGLNKEERKNFSPRLTKFIHDEFNKNNTIEFSKLRELYETELIRGVIQTRLANEHHSLPRYYPKTISGDLTDFAQGRLNSRRKNLERDGIFPQNTLKFLNAIENDFLDEIEPPKRGRILHLIPETSATHLQYSLVIGKIQTPPSRLERENPVADKREAVALLNEIRLHEPISVYYQHLEAVLGERHEEVVSMSEKAIEAGLATSRSIAPREIRSIYEHEMLRNFLDARLEEEGDLLRRDHPTKVNDLLLQLAVADFEAHRDEMNSYQIGFDVFEKIFRSACDAYAESQ